MSESQNQNQDVSKEKDAKQRVEDFISQVSQVAIAEDVSIEDIKKSSERLQEKELIREKCRAYANLIICEEDLVLIVSGRREYYGKVLNVSKMGIVLDNNGRLTRILLSRTYVIQLLAKGKYHAIWNKYYSDIVGIEE